MNEILIELEATTGTMHAMYMQYLRKSLMLISCMYVRVHV